MNIPQLILRGALKICPTADARRERQQREAGFARMSRYVAQMLQRKNGVDDR